MTCETERERNKVEEWGSRFQRETVKERQEERKIERKTKAGWNDGRKEGREKGQKKGSKKTEIKGRNERSQRLLIMCHNPVLLISGEKSNEAELKFISFLQGLTATFSGK